ncbi:hypothetical protein [Aquipuribacter sp. MA13-6]|uniref:hypothetical protein n=1 Tax=unclassified Aquipuribacter TaxID=2635084 RepID=UPI003EEDA309
MAEPRRARVEGWLAVAAGLEASGRRDRALVAARTAMALAERGEDVDLLERGRTEVARLTGPEVAPMHVDVAAGDHDPGPQARAESRAVWVGAPADAVLAMLGWVERDGGLDVVRVVVPGTRRGRSAFATLLAALPDGTDVGLRLPARDPALRRLAEGVGFAVVAGSLSRSGHVGGSLRLHRPGGPGA